jgi:hypothetical protein
LVEAVSADAADWSEADVSDSVFFFFDLLLELDFVSLDVEV